MSTKPDPNVPGGDDSGKVDPPDENQDQNQQDGKVDYDVHRRLLDQRKKDQARIRDLEAAQKKREDDELKRKGDVEKMLENERAEKAKLVEKLGLHEEREKARTKANAVAKALGKFWNPKLVNLVDYENVIVDPDSGDVDELSVKKEVDRLKKEWPELVVERRSPGLPPGAPPAPPENGGRVTESKWRSLPLAEKKKFKINQIEWGV